MGRTVKKLSALEIDEVSLVDRPANQHGLVAIAKREDNDMPIYDADGDEIFEEELEHGDVVYDDAGSEFVYVEDGEEEGEYADENEYAEVGKANFTELKGAFGSARKLGVNGRNPTRLDRYFSNSGHGAGTAGALGRATGNTQRLASTGWNKTAAGARKAGGAVKTNYGEHKNAYRWGGGGALAAGAAGGGGTYAYSRTKKSLGDEVLSDLSKSLTDSDRDEVIAKAMDYVQSIAERNEELEYAVDNLAQERDEEDFYEYAKNYELPIDTESIGGLMYRASQYMPQEDVQTLDRLFTSVGEFSKAGGFEEIGYEGRGYSDVLDQMYAVAGEAVSKSDMDVTAEQAVTALFEANPAAYDEYEAEQRYYR